MHPGQWSSQGIQGPRLGHQGPLPLLHFHGGLGQRMSWQRPGAPGRRVLQRCLHIHHPVACGS